LSTEEGAKRPYAIRKKIKVLSKRARDLGDILGVGT